MISDGDLDAAVAAGAVSAETAAALREFVARRRDTPAVDEEYFRLLTGFNDIFVTIAAVLILVALRELAGMVSPALAGAAVAAASWGLAEYFTRRRRMALPSIVLLLAFVGGVFFAGINLTTSGALLERSGLYNRVFATELFFVTGTSAALAAAAAYAHWRRFKVPITVAIATGAAILMALTLLFGSLPTLLRDWLQPALFLSGLAMFTLALNWDASDRTRTTRRSDVAFWLHLSAAPLIVHPAFAMLGILTGGASMATAVAAVAIYLALAVVALAVDRRALLVSALFYVLYAISALFREAGALSTSLALTALVIGSALLLLSAFWHPARKLVVDLLPDPVQRRLPVV